MKTTTESLEVRHVVQAKRLVTFTLNGQDAAKVYVLPDHTHVVTFEGDRLKGRSMEHANTAREAIEVAANVCGWFGMINTNTDR